MRIENIYFWNYEYRHYLRHAPMSQQNKVLRRFVNEGLPIDGESDRHLFIIQSILKTK